MVSVSGIASINYLGLFTQCPSSKHLVFLAPHKLKPQFCARISTPDNTGPLIKTERKKFHDLGLLKSVQLDVFVTSDDEEEMSEGFFEAIEELERMVREPSDVLEEMNDRLSNRELQLVLVYFSQEGRDSWCALEVFEWLKKENRVDKETMELMVSIMVTWVKKLIDGKNKVEDVVDLLVDMDCVGLKTNFSMIDKVIALYWEANEKEKAVLLVEEVLRRGLSRLEGDNEGNEGNKGGPAGYLAWKMMEEGSYRDAAKLVIHLSESGLKPEVYSYLIAMTAIVKELNEFAKSLRKLKTFQKSGVIAELDSESVSHIENYQESLLSEGTLLSNWASEEAGPGPSLHRVIRERVLAMYICAGRGQEAEKQLWEMKLFGQKTDGDLYDIVLAMCAAQKETSAVNRLLARVEVSSPVRRKKALSWLLRGYIKGGHFKNAAETIITMLDSGFCPEFIDRVAVLQGLSRKIQQNGNVNTYLTLCKRLSDADLIGPTLLYLHMSKYKLWIIKML